MTPRQHVVQFYVDEGILCDSVARFARDGITAQESVLVIARPARVRTLRAHLGDDAGGVVFMDAEATLDRFMDGDMPDVARFIEAVGKAPFDRRYGEMVDVLWERGKRGAAIALEGLWNDLMHVQPFSLLCSYSAQSFTADYDPRDLDAVCWAHTGVIGEANVKPRGGTSA
jgi:hypothetical protein